MTLSENQYPLFGVMLAEWNEEIFSGLLKEAVGRHDFSRSEALVGRFSDHVKKRSDPYAATHVNADLDALKQKRQFLLMRKYASAAGATDFKARRLYAQALIELKDFKRAEDVLLPLVGETSKAKDKERFEARGLLGRSYKQRYVDSGKPGDGRFLTQAIEAYWSVFREDQENVWHGINAASCILRANRDGIEAPPAKEAHAIAHRVLDILDRRQAESREGSLDVWDLATRVEALVDLEDFEHASTWLDKYLVHPAMDAFEVSSTYRQFDEVLQLGNDSRGAPLLHRLAKGEADIPTMVRAIYIGIDPRLTGAAGYSVLAHLEDLVGRGIVATDGDPVIGGTYRLANG